jgi:hypothetical protein
MTLNPNNIISTRDLITQNLRCDDFNQNTKIVDMNSELSEFIELNTHNKELEEFTILECKKNSNNIRTEVFQIIKKITYTCLLSRLGCKVIYLTTVCLAGKNLVSILSLNQIIIASTLVWLL